MRKCLLLVPLLFVAAVSCWTSRTSPASMAATPPMPAIDELAVAATVGNVTGEDRAVADANVIPRVHLVEIVDEHPKAEPEEWPSLAPPSPSVVKPPLLPPTTATAPPPTQRHRRGHKVVLTVCVVLGGTVSLTVTITVTVKVTCHCVRGEAAVAAEAGVAADGGKLGVQVSVV